MKRRDTNLTTNAQGSVVRDPFSKPIDLLKDCSPNDLRIGLLQLFICYAPAQLLQVPKLVSKFRNVGRQALVETQKRFNQMPLPGEVANVLRTCPRTRLCIFYAFYAPEKIAQVDDILDKYRGYEEQLWGVLIEKYGPEKPPQHLFEDWEEQEASQRQREQSPDGGRFRGTSLSEGSPFNKSVVFATDSIEGKHSVWHRDPEQQARDLSRDTLSDSTTDMGSRHASFAMFSPVSFVYPENVARRAMSIMLRQDDALESSTNSAASPAVNATNDFGSMFASPTTSGSFSPMMSTGVGSPAGGKLGGLDSDEIDCILSAARLNVSELCPVGGRKGTEPPPLPEDLSPRVERSPPALAAGLNSSMVSSSNLNPSVLSPRALRRRQTQVSFIAHGGRGPNLHHQIEPGQSPPSALAKSEENNKSGPLQVSLPPALAKQVPLVVQAPSKSNVATAVPPKQYVKNVERPNTIAADDFDKL